MNAAAELFHRGEWSLRNVVSTLSTGKWLLIISLSALTMASALGVIYVKDLNRRMMGDVQIASRTHDELHNQWSKLLLEQSAWSTQARVQNLASEKLGMVIPKQQQISMVHL